ncbi:MAG TPA: PAS domain S-box protein [Brevundimonas sp.]|nr:PAS domain S-box protein [Brevundimonas sp.]
MRANTLLWIAFGANGGIVVQRDGHPRRGLSAADAALTALARVPARPWWANILIGLAFAFAVLSVRWALNFWYEGVTGFIILLPGIVLAALAAGRVAGVTAVLAALLGGWVVAGPDAAGVGLSSQLGRIATVNFIVVGVFVALVAASLRKTLARLDRSVVELSAADARVKEGEQRFRLMADTAPSPVWMTNADAEVEFVNEALVRFYGKPADEILGHVWKQAIHPDDQATVQAAMESARPLRLPYGFEARFLHSDGDWRWMRISVNPRFDKSSVFLGYVGMAFDVSATRDALDALAMLERRQTFLLALSDRLRDLGTPEAVMHEASRSVAEKLGVDRVGYGEIDEELTTIRVRGAWARPPMEDLTGEWRMDDFGPELIERFRQGQPARVEDTTSDPLTAGSAAAFAAIQTRSVLGAPVMRNGRMRSLLFVHHASPRPWSDEEVGLIEHVAARAYAEVERTRAEAEVRESEARFRAIADTAPVLIWVTQQDRTRAFVNQAYVAFNGGGYDEARLADWRAVIHPDDHERIIKDSLAGESTGQPFSMEARYLRHDGEYRWLRSFSRPRLGADGAVLGFVGVAFDVTDAKKAEDDLKRINELLEDRVGEALAEKAKAEADLMHAQRMEAVGRLTGGVAHDFNNLLTVVIGALDIMLRSPNDAAKRQKLGEAALAAARRGEGLTHQLLAFSRRQALRPEPIDLNAQIRESEPLLRRAVGEAIDFKLKLRRGGARVSVDPSQFEAALLNLVVNARDAVGDRGAVSVQTLSCSVEAGEVADLEAGDYVCVVVSDDGAGMPPEVIGRVFEPFFTTKAVGKGTGLGLSQVYGFARQSGGAAKISSTVGEGTEIRLYLPPLASAAAASPEAGPGAPAPLAEGGRLLLVEDDASVAVVALELLEGLGLEVRTVETGPQALDLLAREQFDVMLSDIVMPGGMTGIELARHCERDYPDMRIVLTSGYAGEDVDAALADAPWPFLRKPYSGEQLARVLGDVAEP